MAIKNEDLRDLVVTTYEDIAKDKFEVTWDHTGYHFMRCFQEDRMDTDGGESITRHILLEPGSNAHFRNLFDVTQPAIRNKFKKLNIPWVQYNTHWSYDELEILRNKGSAKRIINLLKGRRLMEMWGLYNLIEERCWKAPDSSSDDLNPYGLPYWLPAMDADSTTDGFVGQTIRYNDGTTTTSAAGLDASSNSRWKSYAALYSDVDNNLLDTMRAAFVKTRFRIPPGVKDPADPRVAPKRGFADDDTIVKLMRLQDMKDDNHKPDDLLGGVRVTTDDTGLVYINRVPFYNVDFLNDVTDPVNSTAYAPIYVVDFSKIIPIVQEDYWMRETPAMNDANQHTVFTVHVDGSFALMCVNRQDLGFVIHKPITT